MRPKLPENKKLSSQLRVNVSDIEKQEILRRVKEEKFQTVADYIRSRLFVKRLHKRITVSDDYIRIFRTMDYNLTKTGTNLNQISHKLNAYNTYVLTEEDKQTFKDCLVQLKECFCVLGRFLLNIR